MARIRLPRRVKPGDGRVLEPFQWWQVFRGRHLFSLDVDRADGSRAHYALDVRVSGSLADDDGMAYLYLDSRQRWKAALPTRFAVEGGVIEVAYGTAGLKRAHYVSDSGQSVLLDADPKSAVGRRLRFDRDHPGASRGIGAISIIVLLVGVGLNLLQFSEPVLQIPPIVENFGRYESPVHLPIWLNVTLGLAAALGASERALRLRYNSLLDGIGI